MRQSLTRPVKQFAAAAATALADRPGLRQLIFNALRLRRPEIMSLHARDDVRFLGHVFDRVTQSKAQILQDLWVTFELGEQRGGYFVEFGATNGLTNSNTWLLEKSFGWTGMLAEPNPLWHPDLMRNRSCTIDTRCVYTSTGGTISFAATDDPELSGIATTAGFDHYAAVRSSASTFDVATISLNDLLDAHRAPDVIDYMSIDTEGSEFDILDAFDFARRKVRLLSVEHNNSPQEARIDRLLAAQGYRRRFPEMSQWDGWYTLARD